MESSRLTRALKLVNLLQSGHGASLDYLARALRCSKRTVFRDIKLLNQNNIRVWFDDRLGGYTVEHELWALVSTISEDELVGLLVAAILSPLPGLSATADSVDQTAAKMMGRASHTARERVNRLVRAMLPARAQLRFEPEISKVFHRTIQAILDRRQLRTQHNKAGQAGTEHTNLSPYQLAFDDGQWCVIGRSSRHDRVVSLRLTDIRSVTITDHPYEVPTPYLRAGYTGRAGSERGILSADVPLTSLPLHSGD